MRTPFMLLILLAGTCSYAQRFGGGAYAGISTSQVSGDGIVGFNKLGAWGGVFTDYRFTPRSAIQIELSFIQKGSRKAPTVKNNGLLYVNNQNMIEMPILYRWYGIKNMSIELGTQVGFFLSTVERDNDGRIREGVPFRRAEWSAAGGLSYYFLDGKLEVNARYANSILSTRTRGWWLNHVISFSVRYWFRTTLDRKKIDTKKKTEIKIILEE